MAASQKPVLINRLREGLLASDDYAEVAKSASSLKVRIHRLRQQGFTIRSIAQDNINQGGRPKVTYQLVAEPEFVCRCCGRAM
jgi:hypothetical protein